MRLLLILGSTLLCLWSALVLGRAFLVVSETPAPADVVVQFVGPVDYVRHAAAVDLVGRGLAPLLMIPAALHLSERNSQGELVQVSSTNIREIFPCEPWNDSISSRLMEDTHKELLLAKCAMDRLQLDSAILVSSPSHMRRIRLMADSVLDKRRYRIHCVAAAEGGKKLSWWPAKQEWWWLSREYPKILWFLLYAPFVQDKDGQFVRQPS